MSLYLKGVLLVGILIYFILILILLKKRALSLKYTLLWLLAGVVMAAFVFFPKALELVTGLMGIETPMNALFFVCLGFILCILMALTSIVSRQSNRIKTLIQYIGLLEMRLRGLEKENGPAKNDEPQDCGGKMQACIYEEGAK